MAEKANHASLPKFSADMGASWRTGMKKIVASYIDNSEKMAKGVLDFQEKTMSWAKDTPWAPFVKAQSVLTSQWIEGSASLARKLWQIEEEAMQKAEEVMR